MFKSSLIIICLMSFVFFQMAPMLFYFLVPDINKILTFVQNPISYFVYLLLAIGLIIVSFILFSSKSNHEMDTFSLFDSRQPFFWQTGVISNYLFFIPCFFVSINIFFKISNIGYGNTDVTSGIETILFYSHLISLSFLLAGYNNSISKHQLLINIALIIVPRFIISMSGPRFFVFQALLPSSLFLFPIFKSWVIRNIPLLIVFVFFLIVMPFLVVDRQGEFSLTGIYIFGSPIAYMWSYPIDYFEGKHLVLAGLIFSIFRYDFFDYKMLYDLKGYKVRFDWIYTRLTIGPEGTHHLGTGGNPIYEAQTEGLLGFVFLFILIGIICAVFDFSKKKMFNRFLYPHIIAKIAFFWRGTFVELFDRAIIYSIIFFLAYFLFSKINSVKIERLQ